MATMESVRRDIKLLRQPSPGPGHRRYVRIYSKKARSMLSPSSSTSYSRKGNRPSRPNTPSKSPRQGFPELSDVPCYTCRRRHVKCDRILPHCAKCAKKGVACLGYKKPLRWADGVAVRGKLKGKAQPVVDSVAIDLTRKAVEETFPSIWEDAAHLGLHTTDNCCSNVVGSTSSFLELVDYFNSKICVQYSGSEHSNKIVRPLALLTPEAVQKLPRDLLNCILGIAAVHLAARHPGNRQIERVALETKVGLFQGINRLFQGPKDQGADLLFCCIALMFAMDTIEHGHNRWSVHFAAALKFLASAGGMGHFVVHYPHMKLIIAELFHFETMQILLLPESIEPPRSASRNCVETLCYDPVVRQNLFVTCPPRLTRAVYDLGICAQDIFHSHGIPSVADVYKREWILSDVLKFHPEEGTLNVKDSYFPHRELTASEQRSWNQVNSAWRSAMTLVVLRYLYFGLPNPDISSYRSRSPTPSIGEQTMNQPPVLFDEPFDFTQDNESSDPAYSVEEDFHGHNEPSHLSADFYVTEPISRTPSPMLSSRRSTDNISLEFWNRRYELHNEAFMDLSSNIMAIAENLDPEYLRYSLMPILILALVSAPNSPERALSITCYEQFKKYMADTRNSDANSAVPQPVGGSPLDFNIPWDRLDAYSEVVERERRESVVFVDTDLYGSAPEWNWWYMLKAVQLDVMWPLTAGSMHMELGSEFFSFGVLTGIVNEECFAAFMKSPQPAAI